MGVNESYNRKPNGKDADLKETTCIDLHVHSRYSSDSTVDILALIKSARKKGLDGLAVTDHNDLTGSLECTKLAKEYGILAVRGVEITTEQGHVLAFGINEYIPEGLDVKETVQRISDLGGISVVSHPYRRISGVGGKVASGVNFTGIEAMNSRSAERENVRAFRLAETLNKPATGGSDAHTLDSFGNAFTVFFGSLETESQIIEQISNGMCRPGGRSITLNELTRYYISVGTKWAKRGFKRI